MMAFEILIVCLVGRTMQEEAPDEAQADDWIYTGIVRVCVFRHLVDPDQA